MRLQHLTPIPRGGSLAELSDRLLGDLEEEAGRKGRLGGKERVGALR